MKKKIILGFLALIFCKTSFAETFSFEDCKIGETVTGNYIINVEKNFIEVELQSNTGVVQNYSDKIQTIEKDKIVSEKIKSGKGDDIYYQYFLNRKNKSVLKLEYKKESGSDMDMFKLYEKRISYCNVVNAGWDKKKIDKDKLTKEEEAILKAKEKLKKEQEELIVCQGSDYKIWTNCEGTYTAESGHEYTGIFKEGTIISGVSIYPGGSKYVGKFLNFKPDGYGSYFWTNGDRYYGEWINGQSNGSGSKIWKDGREYSGTFKNDKLHGQGSFYYPEGKKYVGGFINGKRDGKGTFTYPDGTAFVGKFAAGKQVGLGECIAVDGSVLPCKSKSDTQIKDFSGKDTRKVSVVARKWIRVSHYEENHKKGKKIMDKLKVDFEIVANETCAPKPYTVLDKKIEVLEVDETPAYGLETKLKIGINGLIECK